MDITQADVDGWWSARARDPERDAVLFALTHTPDGVIDDGEWSRVLHYSDDVDSDSAAGCFVGHLLGRCVFLVDPIGEDEDGVTVYAGVEVRR